MEEQFTIAGYGIDLDQFEIKDETSKIIWQRNAKGLLDALDQIDNYDPDIYAATSTNSDEFGLMIYIPVISPVISSDSNQSIRIYSEADANSKLINYMREILDEFDKNAPDPTNPLTQYSRQIIMTEWTKFVHHNARNFSYADYN